MLTIYIFNPPQWHLRLSETGAWEAHELQVWIPGVICSLWGSEADSVVFVFHQWVFGLAACFYGQTRVGEAGRQTGRGEIVDFGVWANRLQCLSRQWLGRGHCSLSGGKGAKCLSIITGSVPSQVTPNPLQPPQPLTQYSCLSAEGIQRRRRVLLTFSKIALNQFLLSKCWTWRTPTDGYPEIFKDV